MSAFGCKLRPGGPGIIMLLAAMLGAGVVRAQNVTPSGVEDEARRAERERRQKEEQDQRTRRLVQQFADQVQSTCDLLDRLETRTKELTGRLEGLETSDDGKKVAQNEAAFMAYLRLMETPIVTPQQISTRRKSTDSILSNLKTELKRDNVGFLPDETMQSEVKESEFWAKERLGLILEQINWIDAAIAKAPKDLDLSALKTLKDVRNEYDAQRMLLWGKARASGEEKARAESKTMIEETAHEAELKRAAAEAERLLKETKAQLDSMRVEFEARMKEREAEEQRRAADAEKRYQDEIASVRRELELAKAERDKADVEAQIKRDKITAEARKKELTQKAEDPQVLALLAPFTTKGYWQPGVARGQSVDLAPVSFSKLRSIGALAPNADGLQKLLTCATNEYHKKGHDQVRPRWSYPPRLRDLKPEQLEELKKAQGYLNELGDILVEQGQLSR